LYTSSNAAVGARRPARVEPKAEIRFKRKVTVRLSCVHTTLGAALKMQDGIETRRRREKAVAKRCDEEMEK